jgi:regulator of telomere elongation helicase 1
VLTAVSHAPCPQDFVHASKGAELCPFYLARELQATSDVLFMPYNYMVDPKVRNPHAALARQPPAALRAPYDVPCHSLGDPKVRKALNIDLSSDILIFDEAHNIEKVCADAASFSLTSIDLAGAVRELE